MEIGDPTSGNAFRDNQDFTVIAGACVSRMVVQNSSFSSALWGIAIDGRNDTGDKSQYSFAIKNNTITKCAIAGISVTGVPVVDEVTDNVLTENISLIPAQSSSAAMSVGGARIAKARRNQFIGNDIGVQIGTDVTTNFNSNNPASDFGNAIEPGNNVFRCNSHPIGGGFDVKFEVVGSGTVPFQGNDWDHNPPTAQKLGSFANGADLLQPASPTLPTIDRAGATSKAMDCPAGHVTGP